MDKSNFNWRSMVVVTVFLAGMIFFVNCGSRENKLVKLSIEGKRYDNLNLRAEVNDPDKRLLIEGTSTNGYDWTFAIPDSISEIAQYYAIRHKNDSLTNENEKNVHMIDFRTMIGEDTLTGSYFNFDKNENLIELKVKFDTTQAFENKFYIPELDSFVVIQTIVTDYFLTELPKNRYLREFMQTPMFSFFYDKKNPNKSYEEFLIDYAEKIKNNSNSLYYMTFFSVTPHFYKSKEDYESLLNLFSPEMQNSRWGETAKKYFRLAKLDGINNIVLPNPTTKETEKIISEPEKHTLLCFTASWCGPCRVKIPLLKEIYEKTKESLNMVYITTDESETIDEWNTLMKEENIEWRSLWLTDENLKYDWKISAIPDYVLVFPDGNAERIKLNEEKDVQALYSFLKK
jgi:thiol-disulfide isomerase/thioredoxin